MTNMKDSRPQTPVQKKPGKQARANMEEKTLLEAGIVPEDTHSQDADRHHHVMHQGSRKC